MHNRIDSFFFSPTSPQYLACCRILFFGYLFLWYWNFDFHAIPRHPEEMWYPIILFQIIGLDVMPSGITVAVLAGLWQVGLFLACIGLFTRAGTFVSLILGFYLLGLTHSFAKVNHSDAGLLFAIGIFLFSRSGDALSVDRWLKGLGKERKPVPGPSGEYRWPVQMIRLVLVLVFFLAGVSKLLASGTTWIFSDHLAATLVRAQYTREVALPVGEWIASLPWLASLLAAGALLGELAAPLALFGNWGRRLIIPALFGMQLGIRLVMGDNFSQFMALYIFWIPWLAIGAAATVLWRKAKPSLAVDFSRRRAGNTARRFPGGSRAGSIQTPESSNPYSK